MLDQFHLLLRLLLRNLVLMLARYCFQLVTRRYCLKGLAKKDNLLKLGLPLRLRRFMHRNQVPWQYTTHHWISRLTLHHKECLYLLKTVICLPSKPNRFNLQVERVYRQLLIITEDRVLIQITPQVIIRIHHRTKYKSNKNLKQVLRLSNQDCNNSIKNYSQP